MNIKSTMNSKDIINRMAVLALAATFMAAGCTKNSPETKPAPGVGATATNAPAPKPKPPVLIEPNAGVGKARLGMSAQQVESVLGKPDSKSIQVAPRGESLAEWWRYPQEGIQVMFNTNVSRPYGADQKVNTNGEVISIRFDTFAGATKEGVGIGSSKAEVIKAFGNSDPGAFSAGRGTELLVFGSRGISFTVITDKVTAIDIPTRK